MNDTSGRRLTGLLERLGKILTDRNVMLIAAESCTGGGIARAVTALPGSGSWFDRSFVTYSLESKTEVLGVPEQTMQEYGVVSEQTAVAMVTGALRHGIGSLGVAVTGVAGPDPEEGKPPGTVCFAWRWRDRTRTATRKFSGDRISVCDQSVEFAVQGLLEIISPPASPSS